METTTLSSKYQIVIPIEVRKAINAKPGQKFWVFCENGLITLIPKKDIRKLKGTLKGISSEIEREEEDRV